MGRSPCCDETEVKKGPWTAEEDQKLRGFIEKHGHGSWRSLPSLAGLNRCGKSCRLRWTNYLRPNIKRGKFSEEEEEKIIDLHEKLGNKWSAIATHLPGRTDNEIKNHFNTNLKKKLLRRGIDPVTHKPRSDLALIASLHNVLVQGSSTGTPAGSAGAMDLSAALRLQADISQLARVQMARALVQFLTSTTAPPVMDTISLLSSSILLGSNHSLHDQPRNLGDLLVDPSDHGGSLPAPSPLPKQAPTGVFANPSGAPPAEMNPQSYPCFSNDSMGSSDYQMASCPYTNYSTTNSMPSLCSPSPDMAATNNYQTHEAPAPIDPWEGSVGFWEGLSLDDDFLKRSDLYGTEYLNQDYSSFP